MSKYETHIDRLIALFDTPTRSPRSAAYKAGRRAALFCRLEGAEIDIPYTAGTSEWDAFYAGIDEGNLIYQIHGLPTSGAESAAA